MDNSSKVKLPRWPSPEADDSVLCRYRSYVSASQSWSDWKVVHRPDDHAATFNSSNFELPCPRGRIVVYANVISVADRRRLQQELADCTYFRAYGIQGGTEPRRHFMVHEDAAHDDDAAFDSTDTLQPGYRYNHNTISLKARPLTKLPRLAALSDAMKRHCGVDKWTIGINPVCYRNYSDSISPHADDNQGETLIVAVVVHQQEDEDYTDELAATMAKDDEEAPLQQQCPTRSMQLKIFRYLQAATLASASSEPITTTQHNKTSSCRPRSGIRRRRVVKIEPQRPQDLVDGDVMVELFLKPGDAYAMDGELQRHYFHSVPKVNPATARANNSSGGSAETAIVGGTAQPDAQQHHNLRIAVVFRCGSPLWVARDSGTPSDWAPKPPLLRIFGRDNIPDLNEGQLYTKSQLSRMGAHESLQKGVSGTIQHGCNAIAVSGLRPDGKGSDNDYANFVWFVELSNGGGAMWTSANRQLPIRVFRSSDLNSVFRAHSPDKKAVKSFRYDGLYKITAAGHETGSNVITWETFGTDFTSARFGRNTLCCFQMHRIEKGKGPMQNLLSDQEMILMCLRSRVLSLPSRLCPCGCSESRLCHRLHTFSNVDLRKYFPHSQSSDISSSVPRDYVDEHQNDIIITDALKLTMDEQVQVTPEKSLMVSDDACTKDLGSASETKSNIRIPLVSPDTLANVVDLELYSTSKLTEEARPTLVRTVSAVHCSPRTTRRPNKRKRCSKLVAKPGEQVAARLLSPKGNFDWVLAVVEQYDIVSKMYLVRDADITEGKGEAIRLARSMVKRLTKKCTLVPYENCNAIYPDSTVFYKAKKVKRRRNFPDPGPGFQILQFEGEEQRDNLGRTMHHTVLNQYVLSLDAVDEECR